MDRKIDKFHPKKLNNWPFYLFCYIFNIEMIGSDPIRRRNESRWDEKNMKSDTHPKDENTQATAYLNK